MSIRACSRWVYLPLLLLICLASATASYALSMTVNAGFSGVAKGGCWTPIAVRFTNNSAESIEGRIVVARPDVSSNNAVPVCAPLVKLPANSDKLYFAYVRLNDYASDLEVSLMDGSRQIESKKVNLRIGSGGDMMLVSVGDPSSTLGFMSSTRVSNPKQFAAYGRGQSGLGQGSVGAGALAPDALPDKPAAYEGVDVLVVSDINPSSLSTSAKNAIAMWVASGGVLVVSAVPDYGRYSDAFFTELLPVSVSGTTSVAGARSMDSLGNSQFPVGPIAVPVSTAKPGISHVIAEEGGVPLVVERKYGAGRVIYLAFDYRSAPFKDWGGQIAFWTHILETRVGQPLVEHLGDSAGLRYYGGNPYGSGSPYSSSRYRYAQSQYYNPNDGMLGIVFSNPSVKVPTFESIGLFLAIYIIVLVPVNYLVLKRKGRLELAWLTTIVIVLAFTGVAYGLGYSMKGGSVRVREAMVIEGSSDARFARVAGCASLFSPSKRSYDVQVSDPYAIGQSLVTSEMDSQNPAAIDSNGVRMPVDASMWSYRPVESSSGMDLGGVISSQIKVDSSGSISGSVKNGTKLSLRNCVVICGGTGVSLDDLRPGATANVAQSQRLDLSRGYMSEELSARISAYMWSRLGNSQTPVLLAEVENADGTFNLAGEHPAAERATVAVFWLGGADGSNTAAAMLNPAAPPPVNMSPAPPAPGSTSVNWVPGNREGQVIDMSPMSDGAETAFSGPGTAYWGCAVYASGGSTVKSVRLVANGDVTNLKLYVCDQSSGNWKPIRSDAPNVINDLTKFAPGNRIKIKATYSGQTAASFVFAATPVCAP